jgi:hypothetical protein
MKISYCITAKNEHVELNRLLIFLRDNIRPEDEVIIQLDSDHTKDVLNVVNIFTENNHSDFRESYWEKPITNSKYVVFPLNGDFATFKNNLSNHATGDFIFQIDADEIPHFNLIEGLPTVLEYNPTIEVYLVPRINTVEGLTPNHIQKWSWNVNEKGWVNFPDYQYRIYKNCPEIRWKNKVHEVLEGQRQFTLLPQNEAFCLYHPKTIIRQELQNSFYQTL